MNKESLAIPVAHPQELIRVEAVNKYYQLGDQPLQVLKDVYLSIDEGDFISIMGPSGSGKSTLINVLGFLDHEFEGDYYFEGRPLEARTDAQISHLRNQVVGFICQSFNLIETMSVADNVRLPLLYGGRRVRETQATVEAALDRVGLLDKAHHKPHELSGGQKQRVAIARALINQPRFIIADEPTGALDTKTSRMIMEILADLNRESGVTIVMVTHDPTLQIYANRHIVIIDGQVSESGAVDPAELTREFNKTYQLATDAFEADLFAQEGDQEVPHETE